MSSHDLDALRIGRLKHRGLMMRSVRRFLDDDGFVEINAPTLVHSPGMEPHLDAFLVTGNETKAYLHTSPEYALKKLLGAGMERLYSLGPCFRDERPSKTHSPEFTMLEWYIVGCDLFGLMDHTEALVKAAWVALESPAVVGLHGPLDLTGKFERMEVREAFRRHAGIDPWSYDNSQDLAEAARNRGHRVSGLEGTWDDIFFEIFLNSVEPEIGRDKPTFLWGWPASQAALSRLDPNDPTRALRFELYAGGYELANAFDELTDPVEQRRRFENEQAYRAESGRPVYPIDADLIAALGKMQQTAGIALGFDRLVMLLTGSRDIREVQSW